MKNPVQQMLDDMGLSPKGFAIIYHINMATLRNCLYGNVSFVPYRIKQVLREAGCNTDNIDEDYAEWLKYKYLKRRDD